MNNMFGTAALAASMIAAASPALAGEITGNGKPIDVNGRSICAYSGINDTPEGDLPHGDPGGKVQSYGYLVSHWGLNPQDWDPNGNPPQRIPGFACNPNRGADLNGG
ncbi:MAG: hypothetical protein ABIR25_07085 [Sphingomicrobium sp.]